MSRQVICVPNPAVGAVAVYRFTVPMRIWSVSFAAQNNNAVTPRYLWVRLIDSEGGVLWDAIAPVQVAALATSQVSYAAENCGSIGAVNQCSPWPDCIADTGWRLEVQSDVQADVGLTLFRMVVEELYEEGDDEEDDDE